jgi:hypothetical protein
MMCCQQERLEYCETSGDQSSSCTAERCIVLAFKEGGACVFHASYGTMYGCCRETLAKHIRINMISGHGDQWSTSVHE